MAHFSLSDLMKGKRKEEEEKEDKEGELDPLIPGHGDERNSRRVGRTDW